MTNQLVKEKIRDVLDFPVKGIVFKDITTAVRDPQALRDMIHFLTDKFADKKIDYVAGIESRGFIFGAAVAANLNAGFILVRKPGKLPAETISQEYSLEYGTDKIEIHKDAIEPGKNVLIIDDLLATGGTVAATCQLINKTGAKVVGAAFIIELEALKGREKLPKDLEIVSMVTY
ncbi:MAG: adenine phosphoribosyltransferase [Candidatus Gastranaerophilales bacterium]|nr:adenine phosphoribosyltransferase [Candidatus Gastranaerophilales bacterium]